MNKLRCGDSDRSGLLGAHLKPSQGGVCEAELAVPEVRSEAAALQNLTKSADGRGASDPQQLRYLYPLTDN